MSLFSLLVRLMLWIFIGTLARGITRGDTRQPWWLALVFGMLGSMLGGWMGALLSIEPSSTIGRLLAMVVLGTAGAAGLMLLLQGGSRRR